MLSDNDCLPVGIVLRTSSSTDHLNQILWRQFNPCSLIRRVNLRPLDNDAMSRKIDSPGQRGCTNEDLDVFAGKKIFDSGTICAGHSSVVDTETVGEEIFEITVGGTFCFRPEDFLGCGVRTKDLTNRFFLDSFVADILCCPSGFLSRVYEDE